jgi:hypothetical protein
MKRTLSSPGRGNRAVRDKEQDMRGSQDSSGVAFRSFLSHRYQSPRINECFFQILSADANPQFAVDPGTIATSVTRLERLIRDADALCAGHAQ